MEALLEHPGIKLKNGGRVGGTKSEAAFENGRKLVHATDFRQVVQIQSEFMKCQLANAGEQMKQIADEVVAASKDASRNQH